MSRAGSVRDMIAAAAQGEAHHSGMLTKKGAKRLFVLRGTKLEWFAPDAMSNPDAQAKGQLDLSTCRVTSGGNERVFVVTTGDGTAEFELKAETANEVRAWMHVIGQVTSNAAANRAGGAPSRKGVLVHKSGGNKSRFFVLMRGHLMWMESPSLPEVIGTMPIGGASVRGDDGSAQFSVAPATDVPLELAARDAAEAREWCAVLRDAIKHAEQAASAKPSNDQYQSMSGPLKKKFQRRFCTLRNDVLLWAEDANSAPKGHLTLDGAGVYLADEIAGGVVRPNAKGGSRWAFGGSKARVGDVALSFVVTTAFGRAYTFEAASQAESNEWVRLLQANAALASAHANAVSADERAAAMPVAGSGAPHMAGWMTKKSKRRWFVLRDGVLYWFESDTHSAGSMRNVKNSADMRGASLRAQGNNDLVLYTASGLQYTLTASDARMRDDWLVALEAAVRQTKEARIRDVRTGSNAPLVAEKAGWTVKKGKRRWLQLRGGSLLWYDENPNTAKSNAKLHGSLPLAGCTSGPVDGNASAFMVETAMLHRYDFIVASADEAKEWLAVLKLAIASRSRENELALSNARKHATTIATLFGLAGERTGEPSSGLFDTRFDALDLLLAGDDSEELVRATLLVACAHGRHVELLNDLVARELDKSISVGTLFRTNSVTTKFVREFLILSSSDFLRNVMQGPIKAIVDDPSGYECDPAKVPAGSKMGERLKRVALAADSIVNSVDAHLEELPRDVRQFFNRVFHDVQHCFPGNFRPVAAGFLFLRFLCPAILAPQIFHLVPEAPQGDAQRALVLVAKVMQNLANGVEFGKKEAFLEPLNKWLRAKLPQVEILYERLTVVQGTPFDAKREAGDPATHVAVIIRRGMSRIVQLTKAAEDAQSMDALDRKSVV